MATLRLKDIAHEAVAATLLFWVAQMEAPKYGHLSGVCSHGLNETPHEHNEQEVEHHQHKHDPYGLDGSRTPNAHVGVVDKAHNGGNKEHKNIA